MRSSQSLGSKTRSAFLINSVVSPRVDPADGAGQLLEPISALQKRDNHARPTFHEKNAASDNPDSATCAIRFAPSPRQRAIVLALDSTPV
jgi:hypothetical protein